MEAARSDAVNRRLAAILAADATNYSGLVAQDEESALRALALHRTAIDDAIAAHSGRIFATAGDSVLAEFQSPVQAVRSAIEMQRALGEVNKGLRAPMRFRLGVNVGDVVVDGSNILGNGVNVAVRLENLAPPGGICVSANVRDHVLGKVDCRFRDLGTQFLKNIPRPVRAYQVIDSADEQETLTRSLRSFSRQVAAGALAVTLLVAVAGWYMLSRPADGQSPAAPVLAQREAPDPKREELLYWESIKHSSEPAELRNYLARYPQGAFVELARTRLEGIVIGQAQAEEEKAAAARRAEAERVRQEAARAKTEAEAAIARAASEQSFVAQLRAEADRAAAQAAAAARAAEEAQQNLASTQHAFGAIGGERVTLVRTVSPFDGRWAAEMSCYASADQPMSTTQLPVRIQFREIRIEQGQVGLPGYFRAYGSITEEGAFQLLGVSLPRTQRIVGIEDSVRVSGRTVDQNRLEANGTVGERRCSLALNRLAAQ